MSLAQMIQSGQEIEKVAAYLDGLDHPSRVREVRTLSAKDQAQLFELSAGQGCTLARDFVPADKQPLAEVIHWGINSLPVFRLFQKRFCWPSRSHVPAVCLGYNEQTMKPFTGPGYFVAREDKSESGIPTVVIDYKLQPDEKPDAWPKILPNSARLSRFIYNGTNDWMWRVSRHVTVGRARRDAGWMDNWFVLCREE